MSSSRQELPLFANENSTHVDWFSDTNTWPEPRILANGTDVAWPAGWTAAEALAWRVGNGLEPPTLV
jgi:hypothetical protein